MCEQDTAGEWRRGREKGLGRRNRVRQGSEARAVGRSVWLECQAKQKSAGLVSEQGKCGTFLRSEGTASPGPHQKVWAPDLTRQGHSTLWVTPYPAGLEGFLVIPCYPQARCRFSPGIGGRWILQKDFHFNITPSKTDLGRWVSCLLPPPIIAEKPKIKVTDIGLSSVFRYLCYFCPSFRQTVNRELI